MPTRFSLAQVEAAKATLEALPAADKDTRQVGLQDAIKTLAPVIRKLGSRGYSRPKILELLKEQGIAVSGSSLKQYLGEKRAKTGKPAGQNGDKSTDTSKPAPATPTASSPAASQQDAGQNPPPAPTTGGRPIGVVPRPPGATRT
jgi:hypothetical protein